MLSEEVVINSSSKRLMSPPTPHNAATTINGVVLSNNRVQRETSFRSISAAKAPISAQGHQVHRPISLHVNSVPAKTRPFRRSETLGPPDSNSAEVGDGHLSTTGLKSKSHLQLEEYGTKELKAANKKKAEIGTTLGDQKFRFNSTKISVVSPGSTAESSHKVSSIGIVQNVPSISSPSIDRVDHASSNKLYNIGRFGKSASTVSVQYVLQAPSNNYSGVYTSTKTTSTHVSMERPSLTSNMTFRFGLIDSRASYNERLSSARLLRHRGTSITTHMPRHNIHPLSRSSTLGNSAMALSSLEETDINMGGMVSPWRRIVAGAINDGTLSSLRREYGSYGSIDVLSPPSSNTDVILGNNSRFIQASSTNRDQLIMPLPPPPLPVASSSRTYLYNHKETCSDSSSSCSSPKAKKKGFFNNKEPLQPKGQKTSGLFRKLRSVGSKDGGGYDEAVVDNDYTFDRHRRRYLAHFDVGSICASLSVSTHQRTLERRNTTTGASAANAALRFSASSAAEFSVAGDQGDNVSNELVLSCPYFRNEVGGETERSVALSRDSHQNSMALDRERRSELNSEHTPSLARGFSLLQSSTSVWANSGYCPFRPRTEEDANIIERVDLGATFYKKYFFNLDHQNWFGIDENLGPVAISIRREKILVEFPDSVRGYANRLNDLHNRDALLQRDQYLYRLIIRTSELLPLRGCLLEESIPQIQKTDKNSKNIPAKEVLDFICPEIQLSCLRLGNPSEDVSQKLLHLDEAYVQNKYKVGLMYCGNGQQTEEEMYNNETGSVAFNEFLELIGHRVRLKGFDKYKAGLCNKDDSTGMYSVYTCLGNSEVMFHVSTLLPFTPNCTQQLPRKRYIGNDIVTVVFQELGALPFIPNLKSQFQHVFIVVRVSTYNGKSGYRVAVSRSKSVPMFGPCIPSCAFFAKDKTFIRFLLTKIINAENAAHRSDKFVSMATRTREQLLRDLATDFVLPNMAIEATGSKFSLFGSKKKEKLKARFSPAVSLQGALSWRIVAENCSWRQELDAFVGISSDSIVVLQDNIHHDLLFVTATKSVIGWTTTKSSIRIYYHQGECLILHSKDCDTEDMIEISQRLKAVSPGAATQEFTLRRNQMGQLGFHVQHDGLITQVENFGYAWQTGLRQGSRLVEICKHPVTCLSHGQMVDLLKRSMTVSVTVIPPYPDGSPRHGCSDQNCGHVFGSSVEEKVDQFDGGCGNIEGTETCLPDVMPLNCEVACDTVRQQEPFTGKVCFERAISPPKSSNSSGYGTGSSRKSLGENVVVPPSCSVVAASSSNFHSSSHGDRWYDLAPLDETPPPPLPIRIAGGGNTCQPCISVYHHPPRPRVILAGYDDEPRSADARVTYLTEYELNQTPHRSIETPVQDSGGSRVSLLNPDITNKKRCWAIDNPSEDENSVAGSSVSLSPQQQRRRRSVPHISSLVTITPSSSVTNSLNSSPRTSIMRDHSLDGGLARKKYFPHRNSANFGSSTLQEDLMKLIGPQSLSQNNSDVINYVSSRSKDGCISSTLHKKCVSTAPLVARIYENPIRLAQEEDNAVLVGAGEKVEEEMEVDFNALDTRNAENICSLKKDNSRLKDSFDLRIFSDSNEEDKTNDDTVDESNGIGALYTQPETKNKLENISTTNNNTATSTFSASIRPMSSTSSASEVDELIVKVNQLESRLFDESEKKNDLEAQVGVLREENYRLQEESKTAAQQLRRFTEWFFQTIDKS